MSAFPSSIHKHLIDARHAGATDLHIGVGGRVGYWTSSLHLTDHHVAADDVDAFLEIALTDNDRGILHRFGKTIVIISDPELGRVRCTIYRAASGTSLDFRLLLRDVPSFDDLDSPDDIRQLATLRSGLLMFSGPPDSSKTTTTAAIIDHINKTEGTTIFTIERNTEYVHTPVRSLIEPILVGPGKNTDSYASGIETACTANARIIVLGELLMEYETARATITALESGFFVIANCHTPDPLLAVERLIAPFPPDERHRARAVLAHSIAALVGLRLFHDSDGKLTQISEMLFSGPAVSKAILESRTLELRSMMSSKPNHTFDQSINDVIRAGRLHADDAARVLQTIDPSRSAELQFA